MTPKEQLQIKQQEVYVLAERLIKEEVYKLFRRHKNLVSFSDAMGSIAFTDNKGEPVFLRKQMMNSSFNYYYPLTYKTFEALDSIYAELNGVCIGLELHRDANHLN